MTDATAYILAYSNAKASMKAYATEPSQILFERACAAVNYYQEAQEAFLKGLTPQTPRQTPTGVSQTHCIK